jgi:hypothetical protein
LIIGLLSVLFDNVSVPARVAKVPVVGRVTLVAPVVVSVRELAGVVVKAAPVEKFPPLEKVPVVVKVPPIVTFPLRLIVRFASLTVRVRVLPAARFSVLARVKSNVPEPVDRIPREVIAV